MTTVLAYHAVGDVDPTLDRNNLYTPSAAFQAQLQFLRRRRRVVPLADVVASRVPTGGRPTVALTFDDAYTSVRDVALPLLQQYGFPATVFAPTMWLGRPNGWDEPGEVPLDVLDAAGLHELVAGGVDVQSHGHAHIDMRTATTEEVRADLVTSRDVLADVLGTAPTQLAWPFRTGSAHAQSVAAEVGFSAAFSIDLPHDGAFAWGRVQVTPRDGRLLFALKTSGHYPSLRYSALLSRAYGLVKPIVRRGDR
jgi:peptidoglycan/xylan/chitin deacetylase (PgdA/CDA1 family)